MQLSGSSNSTPFSLGGTRTARGAALSLTKDNPSESRQPPAGLPGPPHNTNKGPPPTLTELPQSPPVPTIPVHEYSDGVFGEFWALSLEGFSKHLMSKECCLFGPRD